MEREVGYWYKVGLFALLFLFFKNAGIEKYKRERMIDKARLSEGRRGQDPDHKRKV